MRYRNQHSRRGAILILVAISMIALLSMIALAIDLGLVTLARSQNQHIADVACLAGARELDGDTGNDNNYNGVEPAVEGVVAANQVLNKALRAADVTTEIGYYTYNKNEQRFYPVFGAPEDKPIEENWGAVRVRVNNNHPTFFARVFNMNSFDSEAVATAVHRPRDVAIVLDFSGSMHFSSYATWPTNDTISGSMNPDPRIPKFGHYSASSLQNILFRDTPYEKSTGEIIAPNNFTWETENGPPIVNDFLTRDSTGNLISAFDRAGDPYNAMVAATPAPANFATQSDSPVAYVGDKWPRINNDPDEDYAKTVKEFLDGNNNSLSTRHAKNTSFEPVDPSNPTENDGYGPDFKGYIMGPGHYGKSFFIWPPDPRYHPTDESLQFDWRKKFFKYRGSSARMDDNSKLFYSSGNWRSKGSSNNYDIDYNAIIKWIKSGPKVFPDNLRAGRLLYYSEIPNTIPSSGGTLDQRFWREYIDHVIGANTNQDARETLYGRTDYGWGTRRITAKSSLNSDSSERPYMYYRDNPSRPKLHFWFGPLSMICFLSEHNNGYRNWFPGTAHEAQTWQLKVGIQSALGDIKKNHPNDWASTIYFSHLNEFNSVRVEMGRNYQLMRDALFYPSTVLNNLGDPNQEVRPYDSGFDADKSAGIIPNGHGGTSPEMGLKLAYNALSSHSNQNGRRGASKVVIFETDGVPNTTARGDFDNQGIGVSRYKNISRGSSLGNNNSTVVSRTLSVVDQIVALESASKPGYSTSKNIARVHAIAFGDLFQSNSYRKDQALDFLLKVQKRGNTSTDDDDSIESYKVITGEYNTRISNLRTALERIMQSGIQVALLE